VYIFTLVFCLLASIQFYTFWKRFKNLKIGHTLSNEFVYKSRNNIKVAIAFLGIGCILRLIGVLVSPF
jgi:hypothetical protein